MDIFSTFLQAAQDCCSNRNIISTVLQTGAVACAALKLVPKNNFLLGRLFLCGWALLTAIDYSLRYGSTGDLFQLAGALTLGTIFSRSALNCAIEVNKKMLPENKIVAKRVVTAAAFTIGAGLITGRQLYLNGSFDPYTLLAIGGMGFGCIADYVKEQPSRRAVYLPAGFFMGLFGFLSGNPATLLSCGVIDVLFNSYMIKKHDKEGPLRRIYSRARTLLGGKAAH